MKVEVASIFGRAQLLHDEYSEVTLLAAILYDGRAIEHLPDLEPADFHSPQRCKIFHAMRDVEARGDDVTVDTVLARLAELDRQRDTHVVEHVTSEIVDVMSRRLGLLDIGGDELVEHLRFHFDWIRACRARRERLAA